ncbi:unnamed protein product [Ilex paraguariensis]|uniref:FRIGIDA-like protein n=1 Tax=Ilex paraguariensis TaxID=185542 RepID=A0ABC8T3B6_9AQUA
MATMKTISSAIKLIDVKKEHLRKAFEDLQAHSSSFSSFNLMWSDLDSYFSSLQSSLQHKFRLLQSLEPQSQPKNPPSSSSKIAKKSSDSVSVPARPELKSFCEKMDGLGLRQYIIQRPKEWAAIRAELCDAFRCSPDAGAMVVSAMEGIYAWNSNENAEIYSIRRGQNGNWGEVKERARKLAIEWKAKMRVEEEEPLEALGFLNLLATYGLVDGFNVDEIVDYVVVVGKNRQALELCRGLVPVNKLSDVIQKLITKGKRLPAVKFIFEFELSDKFPPVPLLKEYLIEAKKLAKNVRKTGNNSRQSQNAATMNEVNALKLVIKYIEDYNLESEYPKGSLIERIENLEKQKADRKRSAAAPIPKPQQQSKAQKQSGRKRSWTTTPSDPTAITESVAINSNAPPPPLQQPYLQTAGLLPDRHASYLSSSAGPYGFAGSTPAMALYSGSSDGMYGLSGAPLGVPGSLNPIESSIPSESHMPSGYYDRPIAFGGYGLPPQYHPSYYPE